MVVPGAPWLERVVLKEGALSCGAAWSGSWSAVEDDGSAVDGAIGCPSGIGPPVNFVSACLGDPDLEGTRDGGWEGGLDCGFRFSARAAWRFRCSVETSASRAAISDRSARSRDSNAASHSCRAALRTTTAEPGAGGGPAGGPGRPTAVAEGGAIGGDSGKSSTDQDGVGEASAEVE